MASGIERCAQSAGGRGREAMRGARRISGQVLLILLHCVVLPAPLAVAATDSAKEDAQDVSLVRTIKRIAHPLTGGPADYDRLFQAIGDARIVLLGEDTHGTHEFYVERARISQRLIAEHGFAGLVIEGDWSDAAGLRSFLTEPEHSADADQALSTFDRFPRWMWGNTDFRDFVVWLRQFNLRRRPGARPVAIHGMDLYEISPSIAAVIDYLDRLNPEAAARARDRYACFESGNEAAQAGGAAPTVWPEIDCGAAAQEQLTELAAGSFLREAGIVSDADDAYFHALQSARVVRNGEAYVRAQRIEPDSSWNLRDAHMAASVDALLAHLDAASGARSRLVIWAHNAHVGDARATARGASWGWNIGQLLRERYVGDTIIVGFTTAFGTVRAATDWGGPDQRKRLRWPIPGSHAALLHATGLRRFYAVFDDSPSARGALERPRPQRGIGVRYLPSLEIAGHYYLARWSAQFDAVVHIDRTTALKPIVRK